MFRVFEICQIKWDNCESFSVCYIYKNIENEQQQRAHDKHGCCHQHIEQQARALRPEPAKTTISIRSQAILHSTALHSVVAIPFCNPHLTDAHLIKAS